MKTFLICRTINTLRPIGFTQAHSIEDAAQKLNLQLNDRENGGAREGIHVNLEKWFWLIEMHDFNDEKELVKHGGSDSSIIF